MADRLSAVTPHGSSRAKAAWAGGMVAVAMAGALAGASQPAKAADPAQRRIAVATEVIDAIIAGADLTKMPVLGALSDPERAELGHLKGCRPSVREGGSANFLVIDWLCQRPSGEVPADFIERRSTQFRFNDQGDLFDFAVNPDSRYFVPSVQTQALSKVPSRKRIVQMLGEAISNGQDPSLGGLVPVTPLQVTQLASERGKKFTVLYVGEQPSTIVFHSGPEPGGEDDRGAEIFFDKSGVPTGIVLSRSMIRRTVIYSSTPVGFGLVVMTLQQVETHG